MNTWYDIRSDNELNVGEVGVQIQLIDTKNESVLMVDAGCAAILAVVIRVDASPLRVRQISHCLPHFVSLLVLSVYNYWPQIAYKLLFCFFFADCLTALL